MNLLTALKLPTKRPFKSYTETSKEEINRQPVNLSLDDLFVHNFINKG